MARDRRVIRRWLDPEKRAETWKRAHLALDQMFPKEHGVPANWPRCQRLEAPAMALFDSWPEVSEELVDFDPTALWAWLGTYSSERGNFAAAETLERRSLGLRRDLLGPSHPDTLESMNNLALTLRAQGDLPGAQELHETWSGPEPCSSRPWKSVAGSWERTIPTPSPRLRPWPICPTPNRRIV